MTTASVSVPSTPSTLLHHLVSTSAKVAATTKRNEKVSALAALFEVVEPLDAGLVVSYLAGTPPQGRIGVGWAALAQLPAHRSGEPRLTVSDLDRLLSAVAATTGPGSAQARTDLLGTFYTQATAEEADFVTRLLLGELRQGANESLVVDGVARAAGVPAKVLRRALMLSGDLEHVAQTALAGGELALSSIGLMPLRPLRLMLASPAADVYEAMESGVEMSVEWKLDGARIQAHKDGDEVQIWTRNLNNVTQRLPGIVDQVASLQCRSAVLDGEALGMSDDAPQAFQDTMSQFGSETKSPQVRAFFFDILHLDGVDLIDEPLGRRLEVLNNVAGPIRVPGVITADLAVAERTLDQALANGHEGIMVKQLASPYQAGRRGKTWRKVKPVHTFDLVVLGAEWGHGRRQGWLSNLHLGARTLDGNYVMVGKTFKGLTDEMLAWQTSRFLELETTRQGNTVLVAPEQVVEVAIDGVQRSKRYPGGLALRFARVRRYRGDRDAQSADLVDSLAALLDQTR